MSLDSSPARLLLSINLNVVTAFFPRCTEIAACPTLLSHGNNSLKRCSLDRMAPSYLHRTLSNIQHTIYAPPDVPTRPRRINSAGVTAVYLFVLARGLLYVDIAVGIAPSWL